jgi:hypothetical protein
MSRSERKSLIRSRAAALGLLSVASFLVSAQSTRSNTAQNAETFRPLPSPRHSDPAALSTAERSRLVRDVQEYRRAVDAASWQAGRTRGMWLSVYA